MERENRQAKLMALQRNVEAMLAHLSAMSDFARVGGDVDAYEYEKHAAADGEYDDAYVDDEDDLELLERDFNGERIAATSAVTNEDGAMQAAYHRSIFQFRKHADGRELSAPLLAALRWSEMFVRNASSARDNGDLPDDGEESAVSALLRSLLYTQTCARLSALCDATIADSQRVAIEFVVAFVRDFVPRESVKSALPRLPVAMLVEAGNASDHDAFHGHLRTRLRTEWPDVVHVTVEPHMCSSWQRALLAIGSQILPRDWRGPRDLRDAHEWLRGEFVERESPRIVVTIRKFAALPRDIVTELLVRLESASKMALFRRKLAVLLDVVHASADEALLGVPWRVRMHLVVEMIGMPSPRTTGAAVAQQLLAQPASDGSSPFLIGADTCALAARMFVHGTMDPSVYQEVLDVAMLEHVRSSPAPWLAYLPRAELPLPSDVEPSDDFLFGSDDSRSLWAAVSPQHVIYVACLPSVKQAFVRARRAHEFAHDRLLAFALPTASERVNLPDVRSMIPRWLAALDCARFRVVLLRAVFFALRSARLLFVAEDDIGVWWHALVAGDLRWHSLATHPPSPHYTTPWANAFVELHDEAQIGNNRRVAIDADSPSLAGFGRAELRAALQRRLDVAKDEAGSSSVLPLLISLLDDCAGRLSRELEQHNAAAAAADVFGVQRIVRSEHDERVTLLRAAAARLRDVAETGGAPVAPPTSAVAAASTAATSLAAKRKRSIEAANPQFGEQEKTRRAIDEARTDALATLVDTMLFFAQPIQRLPMWELVVVDPHQRVQDAVNPNRVKLMSNVLVRPSRLLQQLEGETRQAEAICSAYRIYCEAEGADINVAEWFRAFARVQWPNEDVDIDDAFVDDAQPTNVVVSAPIAAKLHVFADAVLQLQHHGVVGAIRKSRGSKNPVELVDRLV